MNVCPACSAENLNGEQVCHACGAALPPLPTVDCVVCAAPLKPGAKFCKRCGSAQPAAKQAGPVPTGATRRAQPEEDDSDKTVILSPQARDALLAQHAGRSTPQATPGEASIQAYMERSSAREQIFGTAVASEEASQARPHASTAPIAPIAPDLAALAPAAPEVKPEPVRETPQDTRKDAPSERTRSADKQKTAKAATPARRSYVGIVLGLGAVVVTALVCTLLLMSGRDAPDNAAGADALSAESNTPPAPLTPQTAPTAGAAVIDPQSAVAPAPVASEMSAPVAQSAAPAAQSAAPAVVDAPTTITAPPIVPAAAAPAAPAAPTSTAAAASSAASADAAAAKPKARPKESAAAAAKRKQAEEALNRLLNQ